MSGAKACRLCEAHLPLGPRSVFLAGAQAQLLIVGQAPGRRCGKTLADTVHAFAEYLPEHFPLPYSSLRNRLWMRENPWPTKLVVPALWRRLEGLLQPL
ncbi:MAG: hypothetical protein O3A06_06515 [Proteobacteria bacterium]|nr:hypothetical protein [Pseudomonadota bacterium]MDA0982674.1 hypothetical protein [Pseudomonadota bacterium]